MDFQNEYFQKFLRMRDCDVEKLLKSHPQSAKYFLINESIYMNCGSCNKIILLNNGTIISRNDADYRQLTFKKYLELKIQHTKEYFKDIGSNATLSFIERRAKFYYGEENVWLDKGDGTVVIHFPEILITNEVEDSHLMKDLYFRFSLYRGKFQVLELARTTVSENEYKKYLFSHLSEVNPGVWNSSLCFGATELANWIGDARHTNDFRLIDRVIASIEGYLSWESLKGKPYKYMETARLPRINGDLAHIHITEDKMKDGLSLVYNSDIKLSYRLIDTENEYRIKIINTYDIDTLLKDEIIAQYCRYGDLSYNNLDKQSVPIINPEDSQIYFKDKLVPVIIEPSELDFVKETGCHVDFLNAIIRKLEEQLLNYLIQKENE